MITELGEYGFMVALKHARNSTQYKSIRAQQNTTKYLNDEMRILQVRIEVATRKRADLIHSAVCPSF